MDAMGAMLPYIVIPTYGNVVQPMVNYLSLTCVPWEQHYHTLELLCMVTLLNRWPAIYLERVCHGSYVTIRRNLDVM
jgi:hypothetical protein